MASHKGYRAFVRREKHIVGRATNESILDVLHRINSFLSKSDPNPNSFADLIKYHLNFPPSKQFLKTKVSCPE